MRLSWGLILFVCLSNTLFAQTFHAVPAALLEKELQFDQANECFIYFENPGGDSLQLHWRLIQSNLPPDWDADLCDYGLCYIGIPAHGLMSPIYDTIQAYLKLIVQPGSTPGTTWIWFRVYEEGHPDHFQDVFYSLHTPGALHTLSPEELSIRVFPNPAREQLVLENQRSYPVSTSLYHAGGQLMWTGNIPAFHQKVLQVAEWPSGLYFLKSNHHLQKIKIE